MLKSDGTDDRSFCAGLPVIRLSRRQTPQIYNKLCYRREAAQLSMEIVFSVPEGWKIVLGKYNCPSLTRIREEEVDSNAENTDKYATSW